MVNSNERPYANEFNRDPNPLSENDMKDVLSLAEAVRRKMKGIDVREALAMLGEMSNATATDAKDTSIDTKARQDDVERRFDDQMASNTDVDEVIDARRPEGEEAYPTLRRRLDEDRQEVTTQLAQKATQLNTVQDMKEYEATQGEYINTAGYYDIDDGGGASYYVVDSGVADDGGIIALNNGLYAKIVHNGKLYARQFGVKLNNIDDDTNKLNVFMKYLTEANLVIDNGTALITNTVFAQGEWRKDNARIGFDNRLNVITFDNSSINYQGVEGGCSFFAYNHFKSKIEGLSINRNSINNYVQLTCIWHTQFNDFDVPLLAFNKDLTIAPTSLEANSSMNSIIRNGYIHDYELYMDSSGTYLNNISLEDVTISSRKNEQSVTLKGGHIQNLNFKRCDLSYGSESVINIVDQAVSNKSSINFDGSYFDSPIPLFKGYDLKGFKFNRISSTDASGNFRGKSMIYYQDYLSSLDLSSLSISGNHLPGTHTNLCKNGNLSYHDKRRGDWVYGGTDMIEVLPSDKEKNRHKLVVDLSKYTGSIGFRGVSVPHSGNYTGAMRVKKVSGSGILQTGFVGVYNQYDFSKIEDGSEIVLSAREIGHRNEGDLITFSLSKVDDSDEMDLVLEIQEVILLAGTVINFNTPLHENAILGKSGTTAARPANRSVGETFFDTQLGKPIWWDGTKWVDVLGATV